MGSCAQFFRGKEIQGLNITNPHAVVKHVYVSECVDNDFSFGILGVCVLLIQEAEQAPSGVKFVIKMHQSESLSITCPCVNNHDARDERAGPSG